MTDQLLAPPTHLSPTESLRLSQLAPKWLRSQAPSNLPYPLSLLTTSESAEQWQANENLMVACLRTGDDETASICLDKLSQRFGPDNERVQALRGLYEEATATDEQALLKVLKSYDEILEEKPANVPVMKRKVALLRGLGRLDQATKTLTELLDSSPIDAEAWAELAELYFSQSMHSQAVFCLEEVLLIMPNAWNIHARLGETLYVSAGAAEDAGGKLKLLADAQRSFCRSIELCDDYLRGYYGLKLTSQRLLEVLSKSGGKPPKTQSSDATVGDLPPPSVASVEKLRELSTKKLSEIVRRSMSGERGWDGYDQAELIAARELLDRDTQSVQR
ncbi:tetratricopeptide repeat domain-containing protein, partial [Aureobasidium melanogenum]